MPQSHELKLGRTFGVTFDHEEDFLDGLTRFCESVGVRQAYIPMFLAGFLSVEVVGTCEKVETPMTPIRGRVYLENVEVMGIATIAPEHGTDRLMPHVHVSLGLKGQGATAFTSHLLSAQVQVVAEMLVIEVESPQMARVRNPNDVPLLTFLTPNA